MSEIETVMPCEPDAMQASQEEAEAVRYDEDETYRIMADAMPQIVWSATPDGARNYFNQRWYEHTRMSAGRTKGWGWLSALHTDDVSRCRDAWLQAVQGEQNFSFEYQLFCAGDGSFRWHIERALPVFDPNGTIVRWFGTCTDIDDLKRAQDEIEILNARLRRSMTETHHRVKNNLQIISAMIDMQVMNGERQVAVDEFIRIGSHVRTLATVHDILTRDSKETVQSPGISLQEILQKLLPVHQQTAPHCTLVARISDITLPGRQGTSLALVINELISNAIKHGKGLVEITVAEGDDGIWVSVCDDGPGFPDGFNAQKAANTGLELVDSLVKWDLKGHVEFANQPQGGARVTLALPTSNRLLSGQES